MTRKVLSRKVRPLHRFVHRGTGVPGKEKETIKFRKVCRLKEKTTKNKKEKYLWSVVQTEIRFNISSVSKRSRGAS